MSDLGGFSLHELFRGEAESHAAALSAGLVELEGTSDASVVEPLMRAAHSIKGAARVIGLDIAVRLAHAIEDVLVAMQKGRETIAPARVDMLLRGSDLLASLAQVEEAGVPAWTATNTDAVDALVAALREPAPEAATPQVPAAEAPRVAPAPVPVPTAPVALAREGTGTAVAAAAAPSVRASAVRVTTEKLDRLLQLAGETMLEAQRLGSIRGEALALKAELVRLEEELDFLRAESRRAGMDPARVSPARDALRRASGGVLSHLRTIEGAIRRSEETSTQLYHEVLSSRMRPFSDATGALPRTVRDLARQLGKEARLEISGEDVPVDRDILTRLDAPLNHLLRNAIDHGVEPPDARRAAGKPAQATLRVEARHHAGMLRIRVCDDGRGVDHEALRGKIVRRGLADEAMARAMDRQELLEFLFLPGFSTASQVTEVSGRGVGLDVVQSTAREVGGVARIDTVPGRGTTFELELPITLSVIRALLVEVAGETLAFPLARIA
ncbi:MAG: chemotaxis protein CheA, partial [Planctomycetota bacterium]